MQCTVPNEHSLRTGRLISVAIDLPSGIGSLSTRTSRGIAPSFIAGSKTHPHFPSLAILNDRWSRDDHLDVRSAGLDAYDTLVTPELKVMGHKRSRLVLGTLVPLTKQTTSARRTSFQYSAHAHISSIEQGLHQLPRWMMAHAWSLVRVLYSW